MQSKTKRCGRRMSLKPRVRRKIAKKNLFLASAFMVFFGFIVTIILNLGNSEKVFAYGSGGAIKSGLWNDNAAWSFDGVSRTPTCGDTITIPVLKTITVNSQENLAACISPIIIRVYGTLQFTNGNKLDLPVGSIVYIYDGGVVKKSTPGGGNSTMITIGSVPVWTAGEGPIPGPDTLMVPEGSPLSVQFIYFSVNQDAENVYFSWATAAEMNNNFFTVERSTDAQYFVPLLEKRGAGNSTHSNYYSASVSNSFEEDSYYRLKQTDFDGHYTFSKIEFVKNISHTGQWSDRIEIKSITPNPFIDNFKVSFFARNAVAVDISLMNISGQVITHEKIRTKEGMNHYQFTDRLNLIEGIYFLNLGYNKEKVTWKLIKSKR